MAKVNDVSGVAESAMSSYQSGFALPMAPNLWYTAPSITRQAGSIANGVVAAKRVTIGRSCGIAYWAIDIATAGSAGAVFRLGVYGWEGGVAQPLLTDIGTIDATTTGVKQILSPYLANAGDNLLLTAVLQGNPSTLPTLRLHVNDMDPLLGTNLANSAIMAPRCLVSSTNVTGAFPAEMTWAPSDGAAPVVAMAAIS